MRTKGNKTVRISNQSVSILNKLCTRFNLSQSQVVDSAVSEFERWYQNAQRAPVPSFTNSNVGVVVMGDNHAAISGDASNFTEDPIVDMHDDYVEKIHQIADWMEVAGTSVVTEIYRLAKKRGYDGKSPVSVLRSRKNLNGEGDKKLGAKTKRAR